METSESFVSANSFHDASEHPESYDGFDSTVKDQIQLLARSISNGSFEQKAKTLELTRTLTNISEAPGINPFNSEGIDPRLDPNSGLFDSKLWVKNLRKLMDSDPDYYKPASLGVSFRDLRCYGDAVDMDYQANFANGLYKSVSQFIHKFGKRKQEDVFDILKPMDGIVQPGELTVVLGRPGAGCSTFLKTIACQTYGFKVDQNSTISYDGLTPKDMENHYCGEIIYCAETEYHFPNLTVGDTLTIAAKLRTPENRPLGVTRDEYAQHMSDVVLATYGLLHTKYSKVGNDYIRGVSGGERKRVSIAEAALSQSKIQCWDNSTRGLDSATALEFIKALQVSAKIQRTTPLIAIYQCSQNAYDLFDKVLLLYEGYQIYFGNAKNAKDYFLDMGFECPARQTTADFLTSITNPAERVVRDGFENKVPRTPKEFYDYWRQSNARLSVLREIDQNNNDKTQEIADMHHARQSKGLGSGSPHTVSFMMQVKYVLLRNFLRIKADPTITLFMCIGNFVFALIVSSVFFNLPSNTLSFYYRTAIIFFATLFNALASMLEITTLYEARPIVEKHKTYGLYHPSADALASIISELPTKLFAGLSFNIVIYFMCNLKREPGAFFLYLLFGFLATLTMSHVFRTLGAATKSLYEAMTPAGVLLLVLITYVGFIIPTPDMLGWSRWINYLDPIAYTFETMIANEFHGREFECSQYVPAGPGYPTDGINRVCATVGAVIGRDTVNGDEYIETAFVYSYNNVWRNLGISIAFMLFFLGVYIVLCEFNKGARQKGEVLLFQQSHLKNLRKKGDVEMQVFEKEYEESSTPGLDSDIVKPNTNIFHWRNLSYEIKVKKETRKILDDIDGWVKPGQVTALMGASGAGKTTLLNALSERLTIGVVTNGVRMVNGKSLGPSFQRDIGYVQQQDLHLATSTVKEALRFSAYLRQPETVSKADKDSYVDYVIHLLEMEKYSEAIVGVAGEGLNVEQRKRLTIGVELAAKPKLLLFLDEPTSGLDSQTAWSVCKLIRKLADAGQAIVCTIHQPSAILLHEFDRLLFLQKGGQTVYFGDLGKDCATLINYFEKYGAPKCPADANPAEWMLEVVGAAPGSHANQDYFEVWKNSTEYQDVQKELNRLETELSKLPEDADPDSHKTYALPIYKQFFIVTKRVFQQYWRTNDYLYSKLLLVIIASLINSFTFFKAKNSIQGLQNQMFSTFQMLTLMQTLVEQYLPLFVSQRELYEVRERPARAFSWVSFFLAQIAVEIPWAILAGTITYFCWYYPIGLYRNAYATDTVTERGALVWWLIVLFFIYASSMSQLCISFSENIDLAANTANLLFSLCLIFCGILASANSLPRFWIFMYRVSPFTYFASSVLSAALAHADVECSERELLTFLAPDGMTCGEYMAPYIASVGGKLQDPTSSLCKFCQITSTDTFLAQLSASYDTRFRDMGVFIAFIVINWILSMFLYWLARVPKRSRQKKESK